MMLAGPSLRTVPLTACRAFGVPGLITPNYRAARAHRGRALERDFGLEHPRLAIAALNPHAGEDGRMGDEDQRIVAPAIAALQAEGIDATGPHPADGLFAARSRSSFDVALCMYHDQALIPLKALDFDQGVNVTLGLPIIRTSPDHGTAFAIAGRGEADVGATVAAISWPPIAPAAAHERPHAASLREVINAHGLFASKALGQNFLFDEQLLARIAAIPGDLRAQCAEVGPGPGGLTRALLRAGARVTAIEMDPRCMAPLADLADAFPGQLTVVQGDALKIDHGALFGGEPYAILANLPYNVARAVHRLAERPGRCTWPPRWTSLTLMFQREWPSASWPRPTATPMAASRC
jgi:hypothetical protein